MDSSRQSIIDERTHPLPGSRSSKHRPWLHPLLFVGTFLLGLLLGGGAVFFYALSIATEGQAVSSSTSSGSGAIMMQVSSTFIAQLIEESIRSSGMPGTVSNVQVVLVHKGPMTVTGDDELSLLGVGVSKHFRLTLQPLVRSCQLQVHVLHADMGGIPVTGFVALFEDQINEQLQVKPTDLPQGFGYCATDVRTESHQLFVTYSATTE
jgi:hypothetical protein